MELDERIYREIREPVRGGFQGIYRLCDRTERNPFIIATRTEAFHSKRGIQINIWTTITLNWQKRNIWRLLI